MRLDAGSGDRDPSDSTLQTFNTFYPKGAVISEAFSISPANVMQVRTALDVDFTPSVRMNAGFEAKWRTSVRDGLYGAGGGIQRTTPATSPDSRPSRRRRRSHRAGADERTKSA